MYISLIGAVFTIVANILLIPRFSYMGSAWVSMMAYLIIMVISYLLGQKYYPIPYNVGRLLWYLGTSLVLVFLSFYVFRQNIFIGDGLLLAFMIGMTFFEREGLQKMIKKMGI